MFIKVDISHSNLFSSSDSKLTGWVVENLPESFSSSETQAGEGDTLPREGLIIDDKLHILTMASKADVRGDRIPIKLLLSGKNGGWGTGMGKLTKQIIKISSVYNLFATFHRSSSNNCTVSEIFV